MPIIPEPIEEWLESVNGLEIVLTVIATIVLLRMVWRWIKHAWPGLKRFIAFFDALARLPPFMSETTAAMTDTRAAMDRLHSMVVEVRHEVLPNDGKSMRDDMVTMSLRQESMAAKQANDYERFAAIEEELKIRSKQSLGIPPATNPRLRAVRDRDTSSEENDDV